MKILMMSHYFASHKGGIEIVAEELFRGFTVKGQQVAWLAGDATSPPDSLGNSYPVPLPVFNGVEKKTGIPFPVPTLKALGKINREVSKADVLILHDCLYLANIFAFLIAQFRGTPAVIIQHTRFTPSGSFLLSTIMRFATAIVTRPMLSRAAQVVFISETTRNSFRSVRFRLSPGVVFNGVDAKLYSNLEPDAKTSLRRQYRLPEGRPAILFVGRFVEKKGIRIMKRMAELRPEWTWVFAGWGPLDPERWNAANVRVFSNLKGPSMAALYRACNLLVLPSTGEGFPLVLQEALASGLPVVCSAETIEADPAMARFVRGAPVYADDDDRTSREFVAVIDSLLASDAESKNNSDDRRAFAESRYSWPRATERYLEIASHLVMKSDGAPITTRPTTEKVVT